MAVFTPRAFRSAFEGKKVFLTGHTGFKGSWLSAWLAQLGAEVTGLSLPGEYLLFDELNLAKKLDDLRGDIRDLATIRDAIEKTQPDFIFHLAAQAIVRTSYQQPLETYATNVMGTANLLEACRSLKKSCAVVCVTSDKCYRNNESGRAYGEDDPLGGHDPYSASKAAAEIVIGSYRDSFFLANGPVGLASARAGNVIGGGDWAEDRIVPDCIRALQKKESIAVRNPASIRPWQHVLEPLSGYLCLAAALSADPEHRVIQSGFNFGPSLESDRTVEELVAALLKHWPGKWRNTSDASAPHEAVRLSLATDKASRLLGWQPAWSFEETVKITIDWYRRHSEGTNAWELCIDQIKDYEKSS